MHLQLLQMCVTRGLKRLYTPPHGYKDSLHTALPITADAELCGAGPQRVLGVKKHSLLGTHWDDTLGADTHRNVVKQGLSQLLLHRLHVALVQVGAQQTNTAVDVESHTTCRDRDTNPTQVKVN